VLSKLLNILTLGAFAAHAVFGCCGHHHEIPTGGHSHIQPVISNAHDHDDDDHHHACNCSHLTDSTSAESSHPPSAQFMDGQVGSESPEQPCENSDGCEHERCTYLTQSNSKTLSDSVLQTTFVAVRMPSFAREPLVRIVESTAPNGHRGSPPLLCALLQTWQI